MRGAGGPLLCIGDLLSDIGEEEGGGYDGGGVVKKAEDHHHQTPSSSTSSIPPTDLSHHFQEHYDRLKEALVGTDHSWTELTLKLCTAVETANKVIQSTNSDAEVLSEKVKELESLLKKGDSTVAAAKAVNFSLNQKEGPFISNQKTKQTGSN